MIQHEELENGNLVTFIKFDGDVFIGTRVLIDKTCGMLTLNGLNEKVEIGKSLPDFQNTNLGDLPNLVALVFDHVESIDVVIEHLNTIKEMMTAQNNEEGGKP